MQSRRFIVSSFRGNWIRMGIGAFFVVITNLLHVLMPSYVGQVVDLLGDAFDHHRLMVLCALILGIEFVKGISRFLMRYIMIGASWMIENNLRLKLFNHLLHLPTTYYSKTRTGDIVAYLSNDLTAIRMMVGPAIMYTINAVVLVPLAVAFMLREDPVLTLYTLIPFPFIAILMYSLGRHIHRNFLAVQESYSDISSHVQENLSGIAVVLSYLREQPELRRLNALSRQYVGHNRKVIRFQSIMFPLLDIVSSAGVLIILWIGGMRIHAGTTTLGSLVALVMYMGQLTWPFMAMGWVTALLQRGMASAERIQTVLDESPEPDTIIDETPPLSGKIDIQGLRFSHAGGPVILDGVTCHIEPGMTLGVTGPTGSGKSTLLMVLAGMYPIERGMISYDGIDRNDVPLARLRTSIAVTPQDTFLFSDTIAENIAFGREGASHAEIKHAAEMAAVADDIAGFPQGFDTLLGERGITVSGGQRQRIAIARAVISDSPIMFFDDCLSNVDTITERRILSSLKETVRHRTAIIVSQRLSAIKDADRIIYLREGQITEEGSHEELMHLDGDYAALYREQESLASLEDTSQ